MKKSIILAWVFLASTVAFMVLTEGAKEIKAVLTVIVIGLVVGVTFYSIPKQEGAMKKAITLVVMGFAIGLPGWLIGALTHINEGKILFVIGLLISAIGMVIALWNIPLPTYQQRYGGLGLKIFAIGFSIFGLGNLLKVRDDMAIFSSIIVQAGSIIGLVGIFFIWLAVIEDNMH